MFFTLGLIGTLFIFKYGSIFEPFKEMIFPRNPKLEDLFKCSLCLGFWIGLFWMFFYKEYFTPITPFYSAAVCWFADTFLQFVQGCDLLVMKKVKKD